MRLPLRSSLPASRQRRPVPGVPQRGIDPQRADRALASLQGPIADALKASTGQAPRFSESKVGGVTAHSMQVSPTVNLTYAIAERSS